MVRFVLDAAPLLVMLAPSHGWDDESVRTMDEGFEAIWKRKERYSLVSFGAKSSTLNARARKLVTDWANSPRVRRMSGELCVGSATVVSNPIMRGALTAIMWVWTPAAPHYAAPAPTEAVEWCLSQMAKSGLTGPLSAAEMRRIALAVMKEE